MDLKTYLQTMPIKVRKEFAVRCGTTYGHMNNVSYGYRQCAPDLAAAIELESNRMVTRQELRPDDWARVWPELVSITIQAPTGANRRKKKDRRLLPGRRAEDKS